MMRTPPATGTNAPPPLGGQFCTSRGACPEGGPRFRGQRTKKKTYGTCLVHALDFPQIETEQASALHQELLHKPAY